MPNFPLVHAESRLKWGGGKIQVGCSIMSMKHSEDARVETWGKLSKTNRLSL